MPIPLSRKQAEQRAQERVPQVAAQTTFVTVDHEAAARVLGDKRLQDQIDNFRLTNLTWQQRDALVGLSGMLIYNVSTGRADYHNGSRWKAVFHRRDAWTVDGGYANSDYTGATPLDGGNAATNFGGIEPIDGGMD